MICSKICLFFVILIICKAEAETEEIKNFEDVSTTPLSAALQLAAPKQFNENEILQSVSEKNAKNLDQQADNISSDIEVFKENNGPSKGKIEEETVEGEETPPDDEQPKNEDDEVAADPDPVVEEGTETPPQTEDEVTPAAEVEAATESANNEETAAEAEKEEVAPTEEEKETTQPNDVTNADGGEAAANDEAEMPNDEPAKEIENEKPAAMDADDMDNQVFSCFTCVSNEDVKCAIKATKEIKCPKPNKSDAGKHNGCYTLYQADTNITMRGCVDDLAEDGLKFCLTNEKLCNLCYSNVCNHKLAPSKATKLQLNNFTLFILNISSLILAKCAALKYYEF